MKRLVVLISGRGSNMAAILDAAGAGTIAGRVAAVVSSEREAPGLKIAAQRGVATAVVSHRDYRDRGEFERALAAAIDAHAPDLVVLAGFMRILTAEFVGGYAGRLINIHPSLLPLYPGLHTHRRALADGVRVHGCTVHFVTSDVDHGPIIAQGVVPVLSDDDEESLAARVLGAEHRIIVAAVRWFCADRLVIDGMRVRVKGERSAGEGEALIVPAAAET